MSTARTASMLGLASAILVTSHAHAATDADLQQIRDEIRVLKEQYEARIRALEDNLEAAQTAAASALPATPPQATPPAASAGGTGLAAFNPAISLVLQGTYANFSQDPQRYAIAGFQKTDEVSPAGADSDSANRSSRSRRMSMTSSRAISRYRSRRRTRSP